MLAPFQESQDTLGVFGLFGPPGWPMTPTDMTPTDTSKTGGQAEAIGRMRVNLGWPLRRCSIVTY